MSRTLTDPRERAVEDAADAIHDWANDVIDSLYERDPEYRFHPGPARDRLKRLVAQFGEAVKNYYGCEED
jgi:hypothetical protein